MELVNSRMAVNIDPDDADLEDRFPGTQEQLSQRLKAALHYSVGKICESKSSSSSINYSKAFIAALTETVYMQTESFARDLESFSRHAKRSVINNEDVKLLARRNPSLHEKLTVMSDELNEKAISRRKSKKPKLDLADNEQTNNAPNKENVKLNSIDVNM